MKVTVVVSVYDTEKYLRKCLDSIICQTLSDIEIIIVNDGSPDNSAKIIKEYEQTDSRIVFYDIENKGVSNARNLGLSNSKGEYILFIDSDDYLAPEMLEMMVNAITVSKSDMAVCNFARVFDTHTESKYLKMPKENEIIIGADNFNFVSKVIGEEIHLGGCVWNKLFQTEFLRETKIMFEERSKIYAEDAFFYFKVLKHIRKVCIIDEILYYYYQRQTSVSNNYKPNLTNRCINFVRELEGYHNDIRLDKVFAIRSFTFFMEILHNEIQSQMGYKSFRNAVANEFFIKKFPYIDTSSFTKNQKVVYVLYKYKLYFLIYAALKQMKGRE